MAVIASVLSASCSDGGEELPHVRGEGQWPRVPGCDGAGTTERSHPASEVRVVAGRSHPASKVGATVWRSCPAYKARGGGQEEQPTSKEQWLCWRRRA